MRVAIRLLVLAVSLVVPPAASPQSPAWPSRPVHVIATSPPGGSVDLFARIVAEECARTFGQPFVVENRPGANGNIGVDAVLRAAPDGQMFFVAPAGPFSINASIMRTMPFDPKNDIAPVAMLGVSPMLLIVHPSVPAKDLPELLAWARAQGGKVNYASQAVASTGHLAMELLKSLTGIEATSWFGLGARAGTPREIVQRMSETAARAVTRTEVVERLAKIGIESRPMPPEAFAEFVAAETVKWGDIIRRSGAQAN